VGSGGGLVGRQSRKPSLAASRACGMLSHSQDAVRSEIMRTGGGSSDIARLLVGAKLLDLRVVAPGDGRVPASPRSHCPSRRCNRLLIKSCSVSQERTRHSFRSDCGEENVRLACLSPACLADDKRSSRLRPVA
jgi:hypothetical protein